MWPFDRLRTSTFRKTRKAPSGERSLPTVVRARFDAAQSA